MVMIGKSHTRGTFVFFYCLLFFTPIISVAEDAESLNESTPDQWIGLPTDSFKKVFSLQGDFSQTIQCGSKQANSNLLGRFKVKRPGMYRWEYMTADGVIQMMVSDGKLSAVYDKVEGSIIPVTSVDLMFTSVANLLTGEPDDFFFVDLLGVSSSSKEKMEVIQLTPRIPHAYVRFATVTISEKSPFLKRIVIVDRAGCITSTTFRNVQLNQGAKTSLFRINYPKTITITEP